MFYSRLEKEAAPILTQPLFSYPPEDIKVVKPDKAGRIGKVGGIGKVSNVGKVGKVNGVEFPQRFRKKVFEYGPIHDSEGILYLNSRGLARVGGPLRATPSGNPRLYCALKWIPEESFLILHENR